VRYLITGGAGFIGSAVVKELAHRGHDVVVLDDMSRGRRDRLAGVRCEIAYGDVRDAETVTRCMQGAESVIHMAYMQGTQTFYSEPRAVLDVALRGIVNVLDGCRKTGCRELLLVSSSEAYETPPIWPTPEDVPLVVPDAMNPRYSYGGGKIASELAALAWQRTGILDRLIIVRPHNIYGPDMGTHHVIPEFCQRMNELIRDPENNKVSDTKEPIPFPIQGSGAETRSFCWIGDCVEQFTFLLRYAPKGAEIYHVGTMDEHTVADVARRVAKCYGREIKIEPGILPKGSPSRRLPDISKLGRLGYRGPVVSFDDGLAQAAAWYRGHP
jgi:dTDP-glucose 4,6-dehydratase/UDP-glucose 4-epimerase